MNPEFQASLFQLLAGKHRGRDWLGGHEAMCSSVIMVPVLRSVSTAPVLNAAILFQNVMKLYSIMGVAFTWGCSSLAAPDYFPDFAWQVQEANDVKELRKADGENATIFLSWLCGE